MATLPAVSRRMADIEGDLQDTLKLLKLTEEDISKPVTEEDLDKITTIDFRPLLPYLGMRSVDLHDAVSEAKGGAEKRGAFFRKWKEMKGSKATYKELIIAHLKTKKRNDAEEIARLLKDTLATTEKTRPACKKSVLLMLYRPVANYCAHLW
jgi:hypothetical protein